MAVVLWAVEKRTFGWREPEERHRKAFNDTLKHDVVIHVEDVAPLNVSGLLYIIEHHRANILVIHPGLDKGTLDRYFGRLGGIVILQTTPRGSKHQFELVKRVVVETEPWDTGF